MQKADIGVIGLAVMGENIVINMENHGFTIAVYNRTVAKVCDFMEGRGKGRNIIGVYSLEELVAQLEPPRKVMMLVRAGDVVDSLIKHLLDLLMPGDIIIDAGNSEFTDTLKRMEYVESKGLFYIGAGISGGEEGALNGPSIMIGGSHAGWLLVKPIFSSICAKVEDGSPCCDWVGENGAGHFVKMVHNGIEYGDMQLICEVYHLLRNVFIMGTDEIKDVFVEWNNAELNSYLLEITTNILDCKDTDGIPLVDKILDVAGQKGTGKWTSIAALHVGVPLSSISEAVFARCLSAMKDERTKASLQFQRNPIPFKGNKSSFINDIRQALYAAKIVSYAQGFDLMRAGSSAYKWELDYGNIALLWRGGCIIRSAFLSKIKEAFDREPKLANLLLDPFFKDSIAKCLRGWRNVVSVATSIGVPVPVLSASLNYFHGYTSEWLPANLLQAQRDFFGSHTYERVDKPRGKFFHTNWIEKSDH
jgi:6-phosphogluconate dehydrogenase